MGVWVRVPSEVLTKFKMKIEVVHKQVGERFSCYIPKIDVYFSAKMKSNIKRKAKVIVNMWIKFHVENNMVR